MLISTRGNTQYSRGDFYKYNEIPECFPTNEALCLYAGQEITPASRYCVPISPYTFVCDMRACGRITQGQNVALPTPIARGGRGGSI